MLSWGSSTEKRTPDEVERDANEALKAQREEEKRLAEEAAERERQAEEQEARERIAAQRKKQRLERKALEQAAFVAASYERACLAQTLQQPNELHIPGYASSKEIRGWFP